MKIKNILLTGALSLALTACNDFLEVDAPSSYTEEFVFTQKSEIERALNGVYAQALVNNLYGNAYQRTFILNSDVDIQTNTNSSHQHDTYARFDCDEQGGDINSFWTAAYRLIEYANKFIKSAETSEIYDPEDGDLMQWIGEAKCLRAMIYHDLVVMFGDVPFSFAPSEERGLDLVIPVVDREDIQKTLIEDLQKAALTMRSTQDVTVEHCSKEFAQGLIARIALTAAGYSLRPDKDNPRSYGTMKQPDEETRRQFYQIARDYADSVIAAGTHALRNSYQDVFVNECKYQVISDDDPIFEIPFAKESTGNTGYIQGPSYDAYEGKTVGVWGETKGNVRLNAFYRFLFQEGDQRREFVNGLWYYSYYIKDDGSLVDSVYIRSSYWLHNNKWSKLWTPESSALGNASEGATGINYPYMRYADVLLMFAEAENELDGPTEEAQKALKTVRLRAFSDADTTNMVNGYVATVAQSQETFRKAVLDERKWEFAGENSRWRDLVRTNTYGEEIVYSFLRYYSAAKQFKSSQTGYEDAINLHDGYTLDNGYIDNLPWKIHYHVYKIEEVEGNPVPIRLFKNQFYGYVVDASLNVVVQKYPNQTMKSLRIYNAYEGASTPLARLITMYGFSATQWESEEFYNWANDNGIKDECKYSFYGYIRCDARDNIVIIKDGVPTQFPLTIPAAEELPAVRYILPYPNAAIQRSAGVYKNYYGYQ